MDEERQTILVWLKPFYTCFSCRAQTRKDGNKTKSESRFIRWWNLYFIGLCRRRRLTFLRPCCCEQWIVSCLCSHSGVTTVIVANDIGCVDVSFEATFERLSHILQHLRTFGVDFLDKHYSFNLNLLFVDFSSFIVSHLMRPSNLNLMEL